METENRQKAKSRQRRCNDINSAFPLLCCFSERKMSTDTFPCAFKRHVELRAAEELLSISERVPFPSWRKTKPLDTAFQESKDDFGTLLHNTFVNGNDNIYCSSLKTPLCAWQVCMSAKKHSGNYINNEEADLAMRRNVSGVFSAPPRCHRRNLTTEPLGEKNNTERVSVKEIRTYSGPWHAEKTNERVQDGGRQKSIFTLCSFQFYHCNLADYHIKSYCEQITNVIINNHISSWIRENTKVLHDKLSSEKKKTCHPSKVRSLAISNSSFAVHRFPISKYKSATDCGGLRIGPCRKMSEKEEQQATESDTTKRSEREREEISTAPHSRQEHKRRQMEITTIASLRFQNTHLPSGEKVSSNPEDKEEKVDSKPGKGEGSLKKVQVRWCDNSGVHRIVPKTNGRVNAYKTKVRPLGICTKATMQSCKRSPKATRMPTFVGREFLHIATPKPLIRSQNHTPSDFDELPGFSPSKSFETSLARSPATPISGSNIQGKVVADIFSKRQPQTVFPKNSNFQACITPLNYWDSSAEKNQTTKKDTLPGEHGENVAEDKKLNENGVQVVKSRPFIPRIGPFISG